MEKPPVDWYPDPESPLQERLWDGSTWTSHTRPVMPVVTHSAPAVQAPETAPEKVHGPPAWGLWRWIFFMAGVAAAAIDLSYTGAVVVKARSDADLVEAVIWSSLGLLVIQVVLGAVFAHRVRRWSGEGPRWWWGLLGVTLWIALIGAMNPLLQTLAPA